MLCYRFVSSLCLMMRGSDAPLSLRIFTLSHLRGSECSNHAFSITSVYFALHLQIRPIRFKHISLKTGSNSLQIGTVKIGVVIYPFTNFIWSDIVCILCYLSMLFPNLVVEQLYTSLISLRIGIHMAIDIFNRSTNLSWP